jgi:hypothetical protein
MKSTSQPCWRNCVQVVAGWEQIEQGILNHRRFPAEEFAKGLVKVKG